MYRQVENLPDEIRAIVYAGGSDLSIFAKEVCKLKFSRVHSMLARSTKQKQVANIKAMAEALGVTTQEMAEIVTHPSVEMRWVKINKLLNGMSIREWAKSAGISDVTIHGVVNNERQDRLKDKKLVIKKLNLDFDKFAEIYQV